MNDKEIEVLKELNKKGMFIHMFPDRNNDYYWYYPQNDKDVLPMEDIKLIMQIGDVKFIEIDSINQLRVIFSTICRPEEVIK